MTFTDEALARVKSEIPEALEAYGFDSMYSFTVEDLQAILHRLECSEAVAEYGESRTFPTIEEAAEHQNKLQAWRKSAGKTDE